MNEVRWQQVDELFHMALDHGADDRSAFLRSAAGEDPELLLEVQSLLRAHDRETPFLESPAHGGASRLLELDAGSDLNDAVGSRLGPWRITRALAAGGMGAVYLAVRDDDTFEKQVAVKLVRRGMFGSSTTRRDELQRRFQLERQVLARLDHPCIARLLDGGTADDGRPYFVMEFVEGQTIDEYCDQRGLTIRQRVELFVKVCQAVQHAHQNLVIHRDLKPGNILVTAEGAPKLLDFGLAKLLNPQDTITAGATVTGEFMGTFAFAAPEQVTDTGSQPDTRSDVYSLGMILYRLLAGCHAYEVSGTMAQALERITAQIPAPPSQANPRVGDELDTVVLKALAKEPNRRYQSAGDLCGDLERYLRGEPILAKADSGWYVLRKTVRRYRAPLAVAGVFLALVIAFAIIAAVQASRLAVQRATLAAALRISNIERGRAMGLTGNISLAEELIWPQYLAWRDQPAANPDPDRLAHWALWELYLNVPCLRTMRVDLPSIDSMSRSSDDRWLALAARGQNPIVIDSQTGAVRHRIPLKSSHICALGFRPGTSDLAIADADGGVSVWNVDTGKQLRDFTPDHPVHRVLYSPSGRLLFAGAMNSVLICDAESLEMTSEIQVADATVTGLAISPDERLIAIGGADGRLWLFDAASGERTASFFSNGRRCSGICFSPDNRYLAADTKGTSVALIDVASRKVVATLQGSSGWIRDLVFQPGRTNPYRLAGAGFDKTVHVWEIAPGESADAAVSWSLIHNYGGHRAPVFALRYSPDGSILTSASGDSCIRIWETADTGCRARWSDTGTIFDVQFTPDGRHVVSAKADGGYAISVRDAGSGSVLRLIEGHHAAVSSIALSPDGRTLASASYDGTIRTWPMNDTSGSAPGWTHQTKGTTVNSITWSPDGSRIAAAGDRDAIQIHDAADGSLLETIAVPSDRIPSLRYSPNGRFLAAAVMPQNTVVLVDLRTGERRELSGHHQPIRIVRFSPDAQLLASAGDDLNVRLWSMRDGTLGQCVAELEGHQQDIFALAFSPDGSMLASAGRSGSIKLWSVLSGHCLVTLPGHRDMVFNINFSPDGRRLVSGGRDGAIGMWDLHYYDRHIAANVDAQRSRLSR